MKAWTLADSMRQAVWAFYDFLGQNTTNRDEMGQIYDAACKQIKPQTKKATQNANKKFAQKM